MAEFNSYLLGKVTKSVGNITLVYTKRKNIAKAKATGKNEDSGAVRQAYIACCP